MFFIYYGYTNPDHYDASEVPMYNMKKCNTQEEVIKFKKDFDNCMCEGCSNVVFRIFEGKEFELIAKTIVTDWTLEERGKYRSVM